MMASGRNRQMTSVVLAVAACALGPLAAVPGARQVTSAPRAIQVVAPTSTPSPNTVAGGEVMFEVDVDASGTPTEVRPLRATPPFTEALRSAVANWRFSPAVALRDGVRQNVPGRVLVIGLFRAPTLYTGPTIGTPPQQVGVRSPHVPEVLFYPIPNYPPKARGDGTVIVEIELTSAGASRGYVVVSPASGFDSAVLEAVNTWRFGPLRASDPPERVFVYAVLGFREPIVP